MRYALSLFKKDYPAWLKICNKMHGPILKVGDSVKLSNDFKQTMFFDYLGEDNYIVDEVTNSKWEHFPCDQYIGLLHIQGNPCMCHLGNFHKNNHFGYILYT